MIKGVAKHLAENHKGIQDPASNITLCHCCTHMHANLNTGVFISWKLLLTSSLPRPCNPSFAEPLYSDTVEITAHVVNADRHLE